VVARRLRLWLPRPLLLPHLALLPPEAEAGAEAEADAEERARLGPHPRAAAGAAPRHQRFRACSGRSGW